MSELQLIYPEDKTAPHFEGLRYSTSRELRLSLHSHYTHASLELLLVAGGLHDLAKVIIEALTGRPRLVFLTTEKIERLHEVSTLVGEWPEVFRLAYRLRAGVRLAEDDRLCLRELSEATGWDPEDVAEDLAEIDVDPSARAERYRELHEKYFREALEFEAKGDDKQASEKLWGAITALIKLYAAEKGVFVAHWSRGRMESFITNNIKPHYRKLFRDLLDKGATLHEHFYEAHLDEATFEERWNELVDLLEKAREIVLRI